MEVSREQNRAGSLLSSTARVEAPFVRVEIGGYSFGVYESRSKASRENNGIVTTTQTKYPNYVQDMQIKKINGIVNQYALNIKYPITADSDPNFFEKLLSTVSGTRKIKFAYGDSMLPNYEYKDEEAIITNVTNTFDMNSSVISYKIEAVSTSNLSLSGTYNFPSKTAKPSDVIKGLLTNSIYHLTDVFTGMKDHSLVESSGLIASDDIAIKIPTCLNMSILEYISVLVSYMTPNGSNANIVKSGIYALTTYEDTSDKFGGPYFKVQKIDKAGNALNKLCTYNVDIGYPTANIITRFNIKNNENWSIYYNYNRELGNSDYLKRINSKGEIEYIYSPQVTKGGFEVTSADSTWWTTVTQYPMEAELTIKGLLKPAILMQYVKLNVWFYGHKHISSGYYIIKSQVDSISGSGYFTTLTLLRVDSDEEMI